MAEPQEPQKPVSFDHELTVQQVARFQTWSVDELLDELVADGTRWCIGDCAMDPRAVTQALERRLEELGIARKVQSSRRIGARRRSARLGVSRSSRGS